MQSEVSDKIEICHTTREDWPMVAWLFEQAMKWQGRGGYKVWENIDEAALQKDMENKLQYKIVMGGDIHCVFSVQFSDTFIWKDRDRNDAIYLHRIVANPNFKGQKQFQRVLNWAKGFARQNKLKYIRMDTWADNKKIIQYYESFGFRVVGSSYTTNAPELPLQNRNLHLTLLEWKDS